MHELALAAQVVEIAAAECGGRPVRRVTVEVGRLAAVVPEALAFAFEVCAADTPLAGAELDIRTVPGRARCRACQDELELEQPFGACPCGGMKLEWLSGFELRVRELEVT